MANPVATGSGPTPMVGVSSGKGGVGETSVTANVGVPGSRCAGSSVSGVMSMGFLAQDGQRLIWLGPMHHKALEQFLADMDWGHPDFLLVDMPPGMG